MSSTTGVRKIRIDLSQAQDARRLLLTVSSEAGVEVYELSVAEARALSLELIKQAYEAELRCRLRESRPGQAALFLSRRQPQT